MRDRQAQDTTPIRCIPPESRKSTRNHLTADRHMRTNTHANIFTEAYKRNSVSKRIVLIRKLKQDICHTVSLNYSQ